MIRNEQNNARTKIIDEIEIRRTEIVNSINSKVAEYHNPKLITNEEQPNGNRVYKLFDDFEITSEKGGWAYGSRSLQSVMRGLV